MGHRRERVCDMSSTILNLNRTAYLALGGSKQMPALDYLSPKYLNLRYLLPPAKIYNIDASDRANAPGIAFSFYGSVDYWWVVCMYNGIMDPITQLAPGKTLQLPSLANQLEGLLADRLQGHLRFPLWFLRSFPRIFHRWLLRSLHP